MTAWLKSLTLAGLTVLLASPALADVLQMPGPSERPEESVSQTVPGRGMTMEQVRERFGDPRQTEPAVGDPPITRWEYGDFTVYFEHNLVLHSVVANK